MTVNQLAEYLAGLMSHDLSRATTTCHHKFKHQSDRHLVNTGRM